MLQVGDRVLNYRADEEGIVSRVEGTNVVVDAADGWRWRLQSARNFFLLDDAATPPDKFLSRKVRASLPAPSFPSVMEQVKRRGKENVAT